jgi:hypothetical protein
MSRYVLRQILTRLRVAAVIAVCAVTACSAIFGGDFDHLSRRTCAQGDAGVGCKSTSRRGGSESDSAPGDTGAMPLGNGQRTRMQDASPGAMNSPGGASLDASMGAADGEPDDAAADRIPPSSAPLDDPTRPGATWVPSDPTATASIPVCFTTKPHREWDGTVACRGESEGRDCSGEAFVGTTEAMLRDELEALLRNTWERYASLTFASFGSCSSLQTTRIVESGALGGTIVVSFVDNGPTGATTGIGKRAIASDVHVNWHSLASGDPASLREILREFGRVLGFRYEWLRNNQPPQGPCPPDLVPDRVTGTVAPPPDLVDPSSVMDRCANPINATQLLSPGDVIGAQSVYGLKQSGALVGTRGLCAGVAGNSPTPGTPVVGAPCADEPGAVWVLDPTTMPARFETALPAGLRCLTARRDLDPGNGSSPVVSDECSATNGQSISALSVEWRAMGTLCLAAVGDHVELRVCDGSAAQQWSFLEDSINMTTIWQQIQAADGRCLSTRSYPAGWDAAAMAAAIGEQLTFASCDKSNPRQFFAWPGGGIFAVGFPNSLCVAIQGNQPVPGSTLVLEDTCSQSKAYGSQFYRSGKIHIGGDCLSMSADGVVSANACDASNQAQWWDLH